MKNRSRIIRIIIGCAGSRRRDSRPAHGRPLMTGQRASRARNAKSECESELSETSQNLCHSPPVTTVNEVPTASYG